MEKLPAVYILARKRNGTRCIGVTSNIVKSIWEHTNNIMDGFSKHYNTHLLVWYELHQTMESAIVREKRLKCWKRDWKQKLIEQANSEWMDKYETIVGLDSCLRRNDANT